MTACVATERVGPVPVAEAPVTKRGWRSWRLPSLREVWFQLHWFVGITAGTLLAVIGLTGAILSFEHEIVDAINPGVMHVDVEPGPRLSVAQLLQAAQRTRPDERVASMTLEAAHGSTALVRFAPPPGERRGLDLRIHPYSGAVLPALRGEEIGRASGRERVF